jgi:hypothetical protein
MSGRTEKEILADVQAAKEEYARLHTDKENSTLAQVEAAGNKAKELVRELDAYVSRGAKPCAAERLFPVVDEDGAETGGVEMRPCNTPPMGMLKTPAHTSNGMDLPNVWEVGCVYCDPFLVEREDGTPLVVDGKVVKVKRRSYSARGFSPEEAVKKWNAGEWVEDFYFDRMRGFTPEYAPAAEGEE